jgi:BirA family biotin operon repressor/biotin-[acetyl-CoA-carboxylase] ligase
MKLIILDEAVSTNNYATQLLQTESLPEETVILTFRQTHGRGLANNSWESEDYQNLTFSLILRPEFLPASAQFCLSQVASLGMYDYLSGETEDVHIKWPNDILIGNRKVAGMLIENSVMGNSLGWSVVGIGLNINQLNFEEYTPRAVSLSEINGKSYRPELVLAELFACIMQRYDQLRSGNYKEIKSDYLSRLFRMGQWGNYRSRNETFEARITGTDEYGRLILEDRQGVFTHWAFKEVEMLAI